ncbi:MAG: hypothetical protein ABI867_36840 [Kofleriaceae bacterium]
MSDFAATLREALGALAAGDPRCLRFGAAHHRYELAPPLTIAIAIADVRELATTVGSGGAGPYYGWIPIDRALASPIAAPANVTAWTRAAAIAHLGCGYAAVLPLDGNARGEIWLDARELGIAKPIFPSFTAYYLDWIDRLARTQWPEAHVEPGVCALPNALSAYLAAWEAERGMAAGSLAGAELREALAQLGPGAITIGGDAPLFVAGDHVDPCISCARLLDNLGLPATLVAPGARPLPSR